MHQLMLAATLSFLLLVSSSSKAQSLGSSLEFQSAITLSNDTIAMPPVGTIRTKTYTVPMGSVLKITGGRLLSFFTVIAEQSHRIFKTITTLSIDGNVIFGVDANEQKTNPGIAVVPAITSLKITSEEAIWVPEGKTIILSTRVLDTNLITGIWNSWITGVVFKVVPN